MELLTAFQNLDLFSVGIATAASVMLGFVVYFDNRQSATNKTFLMFTLITAAWDIVNYVNYQVTSPVLVLWLLRLVLFFAVWQAFSLFQLFYVFPEADFKFPKNYFRILVPFVALTSALTLSPFVFSSINTLSSTGEVSKTIVGPGIIMFGLTAVSLVAAGIYLLFRKIRHSQGVQRAQFRLIFIGATLMFTLIVIFNFFLPAVFLDVRFIPLGALFIFPFIFFTSYAIIRHRFLNVKVLSSEILVFVLAVALLFEVILSTTPGILVFRLSTFLLVLGVGVLLVRSVIREVKQREQLQRLTYQLKEANTQLQILDKARAEFISIASHQLRTPPATIKWYVGAILSGDFGQLTSDLKAALDRVNATNNGQIALIDDLLNASRIERGKMEFFFEMGDIVELAKAAFDQLIPQAEMHKIKLIYEPPKQPLPQVMLDKEKVRQVVNNFIDNAIKYTKQGSVTLHFELTPTDVVVKVTDTGRGVAPDIAPTLFDKYTRGKDSATAASGLGLGLYVAKVIIEQNKGKIWVESPGEGKGSTFAFSLPIHSTLEATSAVDLTKGP